MGLDRQRTFKNRSSFLLSARLTDVNLQAPLWMAAVAEDTERFFRAVTKLFEQGDVILPQILQDPILGPRDDPRFQDLLQISLMACVVGRIVSSRIGVSI